jgi:putative hydrolase of the HAD superfamily
LDAEQLQEFQRDFWSGDQIDAALVQFLRGLRPRYKTAILSNAWSDTRHALTQILGLGDAVDTIIISAEEGIAKPDVRIYRLAVERLGVQLEEAIFVDDFEVNVQAARAVGMRSVHFQNTAQAIAEVNRYLDEQE